MPEADPRASPDVSDQVRTIRHSVALSRLEHVSHVRVSGDGAYEAMNRIFPRELYVRDGQLAQGLLLDDDGVVWADCLLGNDEGSYVLLCEGPDARAIVDHVRGHCDDVEDVVVSAAARGPFIGIDGPYAWELMAHLVGAEVIGLPYLTFFHFDGVLCCRAGKTGEYGYLLVAESTDLDPLWDELLALGSSLDVAEAGLEALDSCALENWFFNIRREGAEGLTPLELQLQWRISRRKRYVGSDALSRKRDRGIRRRLTCLVSDAPVGVGDTVRCDGASRGRLVNAGPSFVRGDWVGLALMDLEYALPGVDTLRVGDQEARARTVAPPVLNNRSLYVNPQVHAYASRASDDFPPLVGP